MATIDPKEYLKVILKESIAILRSRKGLLGISLIIIAGAINNMIFTQQFFNFIFNFAVVPTAVSFYDITGALSAGMVFLGLFYILTEYMQRNYRITKIGYEQTVMK